MCFSRSFKEAQRNRKHWELQTHLLAKEMQQVKTHYTLEVRRCSAVHLACNRLKPLGPRYTPSLVRRNLTRRSEWSSWKSCNQKYIPLTWKQGQEQSRRQFVCQGWRVVSVGNSEAWWGFLAHLGLHFCKKELNIWSGLKVSSVLRNKGWCHAIQSGKCLIGPNSAIRPQRHSHQQSLRTI